MVTIYMYLYICIHTGVIQRTRGSQFLETQKYVSHHSLSAFYQNYSFLFLGYSQDHYFWEVLVLLRKTLVALLGVTLSTRPRTQGMAGILIIFIFTVLHSNHKPFMQPWLNTFEFISLMTSGATFYLGVSPRIL